MASLAGFAHGNWRGGNSTDATVHPFWLPASSTGAHGRRWRTIDAADAVRCCVTSHRRRPLWLHIAGDSSMRFLYAAFVKLFNGTCESPPCAPGFPLHHLPTSDKCAYTRAGWSTDPRSSCFIRWRGRCWHAPCTLDARGPDLPYGNASGAPERQHEHRSWRLTFEWLTVRRVSSYNYTAPNGTIERRERIRVDQTSGSNDSALALFDWVRANPSTVPTAVIVGAGIHEAVHQMGVVPRTEYERRMRVGLANSAGRVRELLGREPWVVLVGNGACRNAGIRFWHKRPSDHPPAAFEAMVTHGNHLLERFARDSGGAANGFTYLDRAATMETIGKVLDSPCISHHPYGVLSESHVQMVLNALADESGQCA